jgi:hypothetical protein
MNPTSVGSFQSVGDDRTLPPVSIGLGRVASPRAADTARSIRDCVVSGIYPRRGGRLITLAGRGWGPWSRIKLDALEDYVNAFTSASSRTRTLYLDLFAGAPQNFERGKAR